VLADNLAIARRRDLPDADRSLAYEQAARALFAEFFAAPEAAEALLQVARASEDARAGVLAAELLALPSAPASVQHAAGVLAARQALTGRSLRALAATALGPEHPLARPTAQPLILYAWHSASRSSLALAGKIAALAPPGALIFGVCLDAGDLAPARALAEAGGVPGGQIFHPLGRRGAFAAASQLVEPGLVYTAGPDGLVLSVSAQRDLAAAFAPLHRPQGD